VDSGSTDGSVACAREYGFEIIELDASAPFNAARGRNAGFGFLTRQHPLLEFVQFVDGDCELVPGWLKTAQGTLDARPDVAIVCGRRRERARDATIYHRLADLEWDTPIGETRGCGGDALVRVDAFQQVGGFNSTLRAGDEPELCWRLRQRGWKILRLDAEMTIHDIRMTRFSQWWLRARRAGYAYAQVAWLHGHEREHHWVRETASAAFWGLGLPILALGALSRSRGFGASLLCAYPLLGARIYFRARRRGIRATDALLYAAACVIGKFAQAQGMLEFVFLRGYGK
jgi:GT2 family glycosyltransferase